MADRDITVELRHPKVQGYCPMGCGKTLFLGTGGFITCSYIGCPNPSVASGLLSSEATFATLDFFQSSAWQFAFYDGCGQGGWPQLAYTALGAAGEAGELANKIKKLHRDAHGVLTDELRLGLLTETGDTLWHLAAMCTELNASLGQVAIDNLTKLKTRRERDTLGGSGDER